MDTEIDILTLRKRISEEEFDYQTLLHALKEYAGPRNRITALLREKSIVRVKKGLYVFGEELRLRPVSRELLSNLIYGPSYVSREYALRYYDLIPEEVTVLTSMSTERSTEFHTPLGVFSYSFLPLNAYCVGITLESSNNRQFFIATPEKALADIVLIHRGLLLRSRLDVERYLFEDIRIDADSLGRFNRALLGEIARESHSHRVRYVLQYLQKELPEVTHA